MGAGSLNLSAIWAYCPRPIERLLMRACARTTAPSDRFEAERMQLQPYEGTVVNLNALSRSVPTPIESLQHPLSSYEALVVSQ